MGFSAGTLFSSQGAPPSEGGPSGKQKRRAKSTGERPSNLVLLTAQVSYSSPVSSGARMKLSERMPTSISP